MRTLANCALVLVLGLLAAGCGNDRGEARRLTEAPVRTGSETLRYPDAGLTVVLPKAFRVSQASSPGLFRASLDEAFVSGFAYRRREQLPKSRDDLRTARDRLVKVAKGRDKSFRLRGSRLTRVARAPAIELLGDQVIFMGKLRLRSLHVFKGNGEYVLELVAPRATFARLDKAIFPALRKSLELSGRVKKAKPAKRQSKKKSRAKKSRAKPDRAR